MQQIKTLKHIPARVLLLCAGLIIMAFGVAFSVKAGLGTSPISSVPYVTSVISGLSVGATTIIMNCIFVLIQIAILRRDYQWFQLLQIPAAVLFGVMIDVGEWAIRGIPCSGYLAQWILCIIGILLIAFGVSVEVMAGLITTAGEGIVLAICQVLPVKFGNMKVAFDVTLVASLSSSGWRLWAEWRACGKAQWPLPSAWGWLPSSSASRWPGSSGAICCDKDNAAGKLLPAAFFI